MESNDKYILHLGIYGEFAKSLVKSAINSCYARRIGLYGVSPSDLILAPDGEVIFDTRHNNSRYPYEFSAGTKYYLRKLGTLCQHTAFNRGCSYFGSSNMKIDFGDSPAQMRASKLADKPLSLTDCPTATMKHFILLTELFWGYKEKKNVLKNYDEEMAKQVLGSPSDPFTSSALQVLFDKRNEIRVQQESEQESARRKWEAEKKQIDEKYKVMLEKITEEINQLQEAAGQSVIAAAV